jgi:hypothetical protein
MRIDSKLAGISIAIFVVLLHCGCRSTEVSSDGHVITVGELVSNQQMYASKFVDVRGEIVMDYHGPTLCDESGSPGFFVILPGRVDPAPDFELVEDSMYEKYKDLAIKCWIEKQEGKSKLIATLRGKYYLVNGSLHGAVTIYQTPDPTMIPPLQHRFVLQKVLDLKVQQVKKE